MGSCINVVKATAMASAIAVPELVHVSTTIAADYGNAGVMMNVLLACYVVDRAGRRARLHAVRAPVPRPMNASDTLLALWAWTPFLGVGLPVEHPDLARHHGDRSP